MMNYSFDTVIEKEVLENYLSRAVTAAGLYESETLTDDLRVIARLGVKFLGRASGVWYMPADDEAHFAQSAALARRVHAQDPEVILQACVFEIVTRGMEEISIPAYVFEAFGQPVTDRCFCLADALFPERPAGYRHESDEKRKDGGIPDLNRLEARMWFYYRATRYIDCGYEALHMGQVHLYTANDWGFEKTQELFQMMRDYARTHARRHKLLLDAHTHGINVYGKLLFDYHAMPFTRVPLLEEEGEKLVLIREGYSEGGENPNGWCANEMPFLMEYDNWGGLSVPDRGALSRAELAWKDWWGYDQIAWFANQDPGARDHFLEYSYYWTEINNPNAYFQVPFRRMLSDGAVTMWDPFTGAPHKQETYQINRSGPDCVYGFNQEEMVEKLWDLGHVIRERFANPPELIQYGAQAVYNPHTGVKLPEMVVVYGSFQPYVGAVANHSSSAETRMYYRGGGMYRLSVVMPYKGDYDYAISTYGTLSAVYTHDRFPRSGSGPKASFRVPQDNSIVTFSFRFAPPEASVTVTAPGDLSSEP